MKTNKLVMQKGAAIHGEHIERTALANLEQKISLRCSRINIYALLLAQFFVQPCLKKWQDNHFWRTQCGRSPSDMDVASQICAFSPSVVIRRELLKRESSA